MQVRRVIEKRIRGSGYLRARLLSERNQNIFILITSRRIVVKFFGQRKMNSEKSDTLLPFYFLLFTLRALLDFLA